MRVLLLSLTTAEFFVPWTGYFIWKMVNLGGSMGKTYNMKRFKIFLIFFFVLAAAAMTYFWPLIFRKPHIDETGIIKENSNNRAAAAKGVVESEEKADISSKVTGLILRIPVLENEHVKRGQAVVILDDKEIKAQIDE